MPLTKEAFRMLAFGRFSLANSDLRERCLLLILPCPFSLSFCSIDERFMFGRKVLNVHEDWFTVDVAAELCRFGFGSLSQP